MAIRPGNEDRLARDNGGSPQPTVCFEPPLLLSGRGVQRVEMTVHAAEEDDSVRDSGRRVHTPACGKPPLLLFCSRVHRVEVEFSVGSVSARAEEDKSAAVEAAVLNGVYEALGGREHYPLLVMVGNAVRMVEAGSGERWLQDFETAAQVKNAITTIIDAFSPKPGTEAERVLGGARGADSGMQVVRLAEEVGLVTTRTDESNQKD